MNVTAHSLFLCDFVGIQTLNLLIRSQVLYSVELRSRCCFKRLQMYYYFGQKQNLTAISLHFIEKHLFRSLLLAVIDKYRLQKIGGILIASYAWRYPIGILYVFIQLYFETIIMEDAREILCHV